MAPYSGQASGCNAYVAILCLGQLMAAQRDRGQGRLLCGWFLEQNGRQ